MSLQQATKVLEHYGFVKIQTTKDHRMHGILVVYVLTEEERDEYVAYFGGKVGLVEREEKFYYRISIFNDDITRVFMKAYPWLTGMRPIARLWFIFRGLYPKKRRKVMDYEADMRRQISSEFNTLMQEYKASFK